MALKDEWSPVSQGSFPVPKVGGVHDKDSNFIEQEIEDEEDEEDEEDDDIEPPTKCESSHPENA